MTHHVGRIYKLTWKFSMRIQKDSCSYSLVCVWFYDVEINLNFPYIQSYNGQFHTVDFSLSCRSLLQTTRTDCMAQDFVERWEIEILGQSKDVNGGSEIKKVDIDIELNKSYRTPILSQVPSKPGDTTQDKLFLNSQSSSPLGDFLQAGRNKGAARKRGEYYLMKEKRILMLLLLSFD